VTLAVTAQTPAQMRTFGERIGALLHPGDVVILTGPLGAGKTTLTQGIAAGLGVESAVTSPTFVISRLHSDVSGAVRLIHVDAYRLSDPRDLETLDLDDYLPTAAMVVEWGQRVFDVNDPAYLVIDIDRPALAGQMDESGPRTLTLPARFSGIAQ